MLSDAVRAAPYDIVAAEMPIGRGLYSPRRPAMVAMGGIREMYLQVPVPGVTRDQRASIAIGACCAEYRGTARGRTTGGGATQRSFATVILQLAADSGVE